MKTMFAAHGAGRGMWELSQTFTHTLTHADEVAPHALRQLASRTAHPPRCHRHASRMRKNVGDVQRVVQPECLHDRRLGALHAVLLVMHLGQHCSEPLVLCREPANEPARTVKVDASLQGRSAAPSQHSSAVTRTSGPTPVPRAAPSALHSAPSPHAPTPASAH